MVLRHRFLLILVILLLINSVLSIPVYSERVSVNYETELNYPPFKFVQNGYPMGFDIDFTHLIFEEDQYTLHYSSDSWDQVYERLKRGDTDTAGLMAVHADRRKDVLFSKPVMRTYEAVYSNYFFIDDVTQDTLKHYTIGVGAGQYTESLLKNEFGITSYKSYPTVEEALKALRRGDIDLLFENQQVVDYLIVKQDLTGVVHKKLGNMFPTDIAYGVSKSSPELVHYIDSRIDELRGSGLYEELYQRYFFTHSAYYQDAIRRNYIIIGTFALLLIALSYIGIKLYINRLKRDIHGEREFSREVLDNTNLFVWAVQSDKTTVRFNRYAERLTGISEASAIGKKYDELGSSSDLYKELVQLLNDARSMNFVDNREMNLSCANYGEPRAFLFRSLAIHGLNQTPDLFVLVGIDIQDRKLYENRLQNSYRQLEATYEKLTVTQEEMERQFDELVSNQEKLRISEERFRLATSGSGAVIWETDPNTNEYYVSNRLFDMLGYDKEELQTTTDMWRRLIHPEDREQVEQTKQAYFNGEFPVYETEYRMQKKDGDYIWIQARGMLRRDSEGVVVRFAGSMIDVTDRKRYELELQHLAYYDALCNLPNRLYLLDEMEQSRLDDVDQAAVLFIDLDNFKYINDTLGHRTGDRLLKEVADRIASLLQGQSRLFRLGGDEFVILMKGIQHTEEATDVASGLLKDFKEPFRLDGSDLYASVSIGISLYPQDGSTGEEILRNADIAMYAAKNAGKGQFMLFDPSFLAQMNERVRVEKYMRGALQNREFSLHYQPQVSLKSGEIIGFEALIRWHSPVLGMVSPLSFIKIAEDSRLIVQIGEWVLYQACTFIKNLHDQGYGTYTIAVNISVVQMVQDDFVDTVIRVLEQTGLGPEYLELEITESVIIESYDIVVPKLDYLKSTGVRIALDDFGTGYSSLGYLQQIPITTLKVDKTFIREIPNQRDSLARAIVLIGRKMGLAVVAEGVETLQQLEHVNKVKCDMVQGYIFSKPLPEEDVVQLVKSKPIFDI